MKRITGSWIEFRHHSAAEGRLYNPFLRSMTEAQWRAMLQDMHALGMDTAPMTCSSLAYDVEQESYAPVDVFPQPKDMGCPNAMDVVMDEAEKLGMKIFLSAGFYGNWIYAEKNMQSREVEKRSFKACETMYARYSGKRSFAGWYLPDETEAGPYFSEIFVDYVGRYTRFFRALDPKRHILAAPYGTNKIVPDDRFVKQLEGLDLDYIAWQDEVGVHKSTADQTGDYYAGLSKAFQKAGRSALWADIELFDFDGQVYRSALIPTTMERLSRQIEAVAPHVEKLLSYAYPGLMARPGSIASDGRKEPEKLYADYLAYTREMN